MFPFITFKKERVDEFSYDCEIIVSSNKILNITNTYGIMFLEKYLYPHELGQIMNNTLNVKEQAQTMNLTENST